MSKTDYNIDLINQALKIENAVLMPLPIDGMEQLESCILLADGAVRMWPHLDPDLPAKAKALKQEYEENFVNARPFKGSANEFRDRAYDLFGKILKIIAEEAQKSS